MKITKKLRRSNAFQHPRGHPLVHGQLMISLANNRWYSISEICNLAITDHLYTESDAQSLKVGLHRQIKYIRSPQTEGRPFHSTKKQGFSVKFKGELWKELYFGNELQIKEAETWYQDVNVVGQATSNLRKRGQTSSAIVFAENEKQLERESRA